MKFEAMTPAQREALAFLQGQFNLSRKDNWYRTDLTTHEEKLVRKQVRAEHLFEQGFEPVVFDGGLDDFRPYREGDGFFYRVQCPHCKKVYRANQRTWMRRHLAKHEAQA